MNMSRSQLCRVAHINSWSNLLLEECIDHTRKPSIHHRLLCWETVDLEEVLVMVVAQSCSLPGRIVSLICITAAKPGYPRFDIWVRRTGFGDNSSGFGDGISTELDLGIG